MKYIINALVLCIVVILAMVSCKDGANTKQKQVINYEQYADSVIQDFKFAWEAYKKYAWGHDALKPLTKTYHDWYGVSLLMTPVDSYDTMVLMGLNEEADEAKKLILDSLSFNKDIYVQHFEITIRLLGGLLSAYLLDGDPKFLELATDLANRMLPVFNSPTGMPYVFVNLKTGKTKGEINNPAEIGTLLLEYGTLSKLTGNPIYYDKAKKAIMALMEKSSDIGLVGTLIDVNTGKWINTECHISGMIDSFFEYLLKTSLLFKDEEIESAWKKTITGINNFMKHKTENGLWYSHVDMFSGKRLKTQVGALDAFFPAVLCLAGNIDDAREFNESLFSLWEKYGIIPEQYDYMNDTIISAAYYLRPECIESAYYLYNYTKDEKYLRMGVRYYSSIVKYCKTGEAFSHLESVVTKQKEDAMESFFFAETLKYLYLLFDQGKSLKFNDVIFNTEAHPILIEKIQ
ncbi:Mannosyl-oligosaccharide 1,2-alpha-mannosidase [Melioribacter roseus P3M-2]|uniref:Mannosyl-oligosaccharide 1,2-alpha-mannosidase n=1 Tax=Melioribacter roseus (strain DSM 23840 / JCM 17771 / VKM B-2668 / P3M-2) TaxID=1191523 RepID=I7A4J9_MELRP|nr:glycoside hydrolase family 47 protein [Melioribacter roseus]AFN74821.1 Mannosyl-oligosaccharide 1,2-alpha-mannosidase [Melioribacter roseus P3M-2]